MSPKRWLAVFIVLSLLLLILLPACGGGNGKETSTPTSLPSLTPTTIATAVPTLTPTATAMSTLTPTLAGPVKVGAIAPWSGTMGVASVLTDQIIALVEEQVKNMGGILGGREIKFVRGDDRGILAESVAQAKKLVLEDKVTILTLGGINTAGFTAVANIAEELKVPFISFAQISGVAAMKYSACQMWHGASIDEIARFIIDVLKPKTVAWLANEAEDAHQMVDGVEDIVGIRDQLKAAGIDIVYEEYFLPGTMDLSPYLTKIKYLSPDVLATYFNDTGYAVTINKQITELGGWGSIKYYGATPSASAKAAIKMPSAVGTYTNVYWLPGSDEPGMKAFEDAFRQKYGYLPDPNLSFFYNCFWTAIKAIELAGTDDHDKVAQALRSGNLEWDSAWGPLRINTDGRGEITSMIVQVQEGGEMVKVWPQ